MRQIDVEHDANNDLADSFDWYESQKPGLGARFVEKVGSAFEAAASNPTFYPYVHSMTRRVMVEVFPFVVLFRDYPDRIVILGVIHSSRDPRRLKGRSW